MPKTVIQHVGAGFYKNMAYHIAQGEYAIVDALRRSADRSKVNLKPLDFDVWVAQYCNDPDLVRQLIYHEDLESIAEEVCVQYLQELLSF